MQHWGSGPQLSKGTPSSPKSQKLFEDKDVYKRQVVKFGHNYHTIILQHFKLPNIWNPLKMYTKKNLFCFLGKTKLFSLTGIHDYHDRILTGIDW